MTIYEFNLLEHAEKEEMIWNYGTFLVNIDEGKKMCDVYELNGFYVAFCYELNKNLRATISAAVHAESLPYVSMVRKLM